MKGRASRFWIAAAAACLLIPSALRIAAQDARAILLEPDSVNARRSRVPPGRSRFSPSS